MYIGCHYIVIEHLLSVPTESSFVADTRILLVVVVQHALVTRLAVTVGLMTGMMGVVVLVKREMVVLY